MDGVNEPQYGEKEYTRSLRKIHERQGVSSFDAIIQSEAAVMATTINGGNWNKDYTEAQKIGWCLKVLWAVDRYASIKADELTLMYGDQNHTGGAPEGLLGTRIEGGE